MDERVERAAAAEREAAEAPTDHLRQVHEQKAEVHERAAESQDRAADSQARHARAERDLIAGD